MDIQVILTGNDPKLGKRGQVIKVSQGYAQNFLFPHNKAKLATSSNLKEFEIEKEKHSKEEAQKLAEAKASAEKIKNTPIKLEVSSGGGDKLFGAVTTQDIVDALAKQGIACDRKKLHLEEPIKRLGHYQVEIKLHPEIHVKLALEVAKKS